ncbi:C40 family peptidase [Pedobacter metabolipauper]|uniref:SH3 domain-containing protein n=1 Tax=Pedobacter metabolipauper TaxID=425513 RepID=A0A4R6SSY7_9SPHI|nr:C40 family peptidase [Pedobacter metabolipauper]TDQ08515.1 SH3 domain-containing protein [Pedobacter metabolipauper]
MEQLYGICRVAVAPLRAEPSDKAEISSQLLFGEHVEILQKDERWWQVRNAYDGYEGWMDFKQLSMLTLEQYVENHDCPHLVPAELNNLLIAADGSKYYLSPGSNLPMFDDGFCYLGDEKYEVLFKPRIVHSETYTIVDYALFFQNVPYLWGGRNLFGIDCSGFVQTVFKLNGIKLNRDAWQQAEQGVLVDFLPEVRPGDVAFFDNDEGRITHVGIMLSPSEIIHASGKVRIDQIDNQGIYNAELGRYTHKLRIIKRFS